MKRLFTAAIFLFASYAAVLAANTQQTVTQVTEAITLTEDVDYHISSTTPFTTTGSINIVNTDHAVVIMDNLRPTLAKAYLGYISINGEPAVDGTNCQLKLYARGAIVMPYGGSSFYPLTVFEGEDFTGDSYNKLFEGHNGSGFMKDLPTSWNNRIKSFKLKRGYMVTFALKSGGYGYSRCFIADNEDLEMNLPALMANRISSYRLFKWYDSRKANLAHTLYTSALLATRSSTAFEHNFHANDYLLPDIENFPAHYKRSWPSASQVGSMETSPHLKHDNEPLNHDDEEWYESLDEAVNGTLATWEQFMRTGRRIMTPSSWDGTNGEELLHRVLDSIDARGWRCDIIDMHCYWPEGSFNNLKGWVNRHNRPIWITEWVWGASWNRNGIFGVASSWDNPTEADYQKNKEGIQRITDKLNSWDYVERYFYWNEERVVSKVYLDNGTLTPAGEYYANMEDPVTSTKGVNYIPTAPPTKAITDLTGSYVPRTGICTLKWTNMNGDLSDVVALQRKIDSGTWQTVYSFKGTENEDLTNLSIPDTIEPGAVYTYRVVDTLYNKAVKTSNEYKFYTAQSAGTDALQYGTITSMPTLQAYSYFQTPFTTQPVIVTGSATYKNLATTSNPIGIVNNPLSITKGASGNYEYFNYQEKPWYYFSGTDFVQMTATKEESTNFIAAQPGCGKIGDLQYEAGYVSTNEETDGSYASGTSVKGTVVEVKFMQPFEEAPVVMVTPIHSSAALAVMTWRIYDVTAEGFKLQLLQQKGETRTYTGRKVGYIAIEKGTGRDNGKLYTVGDSTYTFRTSQVKLNYPVTYSATPLAMAQLQTYNHQAAAIMRIPSVKTNYANFRMQVDPSDTDNILSTSVSATENVGYILIGDDPDYDGIENITTPATAPRDTRIYDLSGRRVQHGQLRKGVYIINGQKIMVK